MHIFVVDKNTEYASYHGKYALKSHLTRSTSGLSAFRHVTAELSLSLFVVSSNGNERYKTRLKSTTGIGRNSEALECETACDHFKFVSTSIESDPSASAET